MTSLLSQSKALAQVSSSDNEMSTDNHYNNNNNNNKINSGIRSNVHTTLRNTNGNGNDVVKQESGHSVNSVDMISQLIMVTNENENGKDKDKDRDKDKDDDTVEYQENWQQQMMQLSGQQGGSALSLQSLSLPSAKNSVVSTQVNSHYVLMENQTSTFD